MKSFHHLLLALICCSLVYAPTAQAAMLCCPHAAKSVNATVTAKPMAEMPCHKTSAQKQQKAATISGCHCNSCVVMSAIIMPLMQVGDSVPVIQAVPEQNPQLGLYSPPSIYIPPIAHS